MQIYFRVFQAAYALMEPALRSIAARSPSGGICLAHMGDGGAGNYVKMVRVIVLLCCKKNIFGFTSSAMKKTRVTHSKIPA